MKIEELINRLQKFAIEKPGVEVEVEVLNKKGDLVFAREDTFEVEMGLGWDENDNEIQKVRISVQRYRKR